MSKIVVLAGEFRLVAEADYHINFFTPSDEAQRDGIADNPLP